MNELKVLQIIDANLNRLREGLRVIQDYFRYTQSFQMLFKKVRMLTHHSGNLEKKLRKKLSPKISLARDLSHDAGKPSDRFVKYKISQSETSKMRKPKTGEIISANFKRAQEAGRNLEEYLKILGLQNESEAYRKVRFNLYEIEESYIKENFENRESERRRKNLERALEHLPICLVISEENTLKRTPLELALAFYRMGGRLVQVRLKGLSDKRIVEFTRELKDKLPASIVIVNDRVDVALIGNADGVHLGDEDISTKDARKIACELIIGKTVRNVDGALREVNSGVDYLGVGSVYQSKTKPHSKVIGLSQLRRIVKAVNTPVIAIGGINEGNFDKVLKAGASGIAVISAMAEPSESRKFLRMVKDYWLKRDETKS